MRSGSRNSAASIPPRSHGRGKAPASSRSSSHDGNTYRAVYTVRFPEVVYALHAFQKKSPKGIRTARSDVELIERRLKMAQRDYEARYGTSKI